MRPQLPHLVLNEIQLLLVEADFFADGSRAVRYDLHPPQPQVSVISLFPNVQIAHIVKLHERAEDSLIRNVIFQQFVQFGQLKGFFAEGTEDCGQTLGIDREIGVLQQLRGDGGLVGIIVVHDVHCDSSFDFEKLCLKGGLDGLVSLSPSRRQFLIVCQVARKNFGRAEGPLYNQRTFFLKNLAPFFKKLFLPLILPLLS